MIEQKKKLRLDEIQIDSFVTSPTLKTLETQEHEIKGGTWFGAWCWIAENVIAVSMKVCSENAPGGCYKTDPTMLAKIGAC